MKTQVCWQPSCLPSALPPSGLASQAPPLSSPDPPHFGPVCSLHPKPAHISTLHALATFPVLSGFPHPHLQHSAPRPAQGGRQRRELSCFCSKGIWMFFHQERHSFSPLPSLTPDSAPPLTSTPILSLTVLAPQFSLLPHPPPSLPASPSLWFLPPGQVLALGGLRDASGNLLLPGDSFVEPLSRKPVRLQGASLQEGWTVPHTGGPQNLLDANVLAAQRRVIAVLRSSQERPDS